ncbi:MAG: hypothetical protein MHM6MM_002989 [Cercozoa sp. M6MM]
MMANVDVRAEVCDEIMRAERWFAPRAASSLQERLHALFRAGVEAAAGAEASKHEDAVLALAWLLREAPVLTDEALDHVGAWRRADALARVTTLATEQPIRAEALCVAADWLLTLSPRFASGCELINTRALFAAAASEETRVRVRAASALARALRLSAQRRRQLLQAASRGLSETQLQAIVSDSDSNEIKTVSLQEAGTSTTTDTDTDTDRDTCRDTCRDTGADTDEEQDTSVLLRDGCVVVAGVPLPLAHAADTADRNTEDALVPVPSTLRNLRALALAVSHSSSPVLLEGVSGSGKSTLLRHLATCTGRLQDLVVVHLDDQVDSKTLLGQHLCTDTPGEFKWTPGALTRAVQEGKWVLVEDICTAADDVKTALKPLLERNELFLHDRQLTVPAAPGFRLLATRTTLTSNFDDNLSPLDAALLQQMARVRCEPLQQEELQRVLERKFPRTSALCVQSLLDSWALLCDSILELDIGSVPVRTALGSRRVSLRDLFKATARIERFLQAPSRRGASLMTTAMRERALAELLDCCVVTAPRLEVRLALLRQLARIWTVDTAVVEAKETREAPTLQLHTDRGSVAVTQVGRAQLPHLSNTKTHQDTFALTGHALRLMQRVACSLLYREPLLLVGESGCGKTSVVQHIAARTGRTLLVHNLNQQSDASELIGTFRPMDLRSQATPLLRSFQALFPRTVSAQENARFLSAVQGAYSNSDWRRMCRAMGRMRGLVEQKQKDMEARLRANWERFFSVLEAFSRKSRRVASSGGAFAFEFVDGVLTRALKEGHWLLLDEVNLASAETLQRLASVLDACSGGKLLLLEKGDNEDIQVHPDFRLLACMNPPTDHGKRDLPAALRCRFTEIFVHEPSDRADLCMVINRVLGEDLRSRLPVDAIAETFETLKAKAASGEIVDGDGKKPHFSLRSLTRSLRFCSSQAHIYGSWRALYEGIVLTFTTCLDDKSRVVADAVVRGTIFGGKNEQHLRRLKGVRSKFDGRQDMVLVDRFFLPRGELEPQQHDTKFVVTPTVRLRLSAVARAVASGLPVLLQGPTSAGKTSLVEHLARRCGHVCVRINNHEHTDIQEYLGAYVSGPDGRLQFQEGPLVQAVRHGHWVILDELNLAPSDVLEALNRLLDDNRELRIEETRSTIKAHAKFRLFATQNPPGLYGGRKVLSRAFRNRFVELHVGDVPRNELITILEKRCGVAPSRAKLMLDVMGDLQRARQHSHVFEGKRGFVTPRDLFRWANRVGREQSLEKIALEGFMLLGERCRAQDERDFVASVLGEHCKVDVLALVGRFYAQVEWPDVAQYEEALAQQGLRHVTATAAARRLYALVSRCAAHQEPALIVGGTGCGKTTVCQLLAMVAGRRLRIVNCHQNTETADFLGALHPVRGKPTLRGRLRQALRRLVQLLSLRGEVPQHTLDELRPATTDSSLDSSSPDSQDQDVPLDRHMVVFDKVVAQLRASEPVDAECADLLHSIESDWRRHQSLFEWRDGALVQSMKEGDWFLADEISLADDAVIERLNSVLEPSRTLFLAEKGGAGDDECVRAHEQWRIVATMNPGGDFGKKELSPALRNRFTEIWVDAAQAPDDVLRIVSTRVNSDVATRVIAFVDWFNSAHGAATQRHLSLRDVLAWADFIARTSGQEQGELTAREAFLHGAGLMVLDGVGCGTGASREAAMLVRDECRAKLHELWPCDTPAEAHEDVDAKEVSDDATRFGVAPFFVRKSEGARGLAALSGTRNTEEGVAKKDAAKKDTEDTDQQKQPFSFAAPTTRSNLVKLLRGMQLPRALLLEGSPGVGKTTIVQALGRCVGRRVVRINLSEQTDMADLLGTDLPTPDGKFAWSDGAFLQALKQGDWVLLDELNLASQSVLEGLNAVLDHRAEVFIPELQRTFQCPASFRLFACQNPVAQGGGRKGLPASFLNRFTKIYLDDMCRADLSCLMTQLAPDIPEAVRGTLVRVNDAVNDAVVLRKEVAATALDGAPFEFNLRDMLRWSVLLRSRPVSARTHLLKKSATVDLHVDDLHVDDSDVAETFEFLYAQRMRTPVARKAVRQLFREVTQLPLLQAIRQETPLHVLPDTVVIGDVVLPRGDGLADPLGSDGGSEDLVVPRAARRRVLCHLARAVSLAWPALLVGDAASGKTALVRTLARLCRRSLHELSLNAGMDAGELLGCFEQVDVARHTRRALEQLERRCRCVVTSLLTGSYDTNKVQRAGGLNDLWNALASRASHLHYAADKELASSALALLQELKLTATSLGVEYDHEDSSLRELLASLPAMTERGTIGHFEWCDGTLLRAIEEGHWLLMDNVNFCQASVLDRLNSLLEPSGLLTVNECGLQDGQLRVVRPHADFRLFLAMDARFGDVSRAMRNRCVELALHTPHELSQAEQEDLVDMVCAKGLHADTAALLVQAHMNLVSLLPIDGAVRRLMRWVALVRRALSSVGDAAALPVRRHVVLAAEQCYDAVFAREQDRARAVLEQALSSAGGAMRLQKRLGSSALREDDVRADTTQAVMQLECQHVRELALLLASTQVHADRLTPTSAERRAATLLSQTAPRLSKLRDRRDAVLQEHLHGHAVEALCGTLLLHPRAAVLQALPRAARQEVTSLNAHMSALLPLQLVLTQDELLLEETFAALKQKESTTQQTSSDARSEPEASAWLLSWLHFTERRSLPKCANRGLWSVLHAAVSRADERAVQLAAEAAPTATSFVARYTGARDALAASLQVPPARVSLHGAMERLRQLDALVDVDALTQVRQVLSGSVDIDGDAFASWWRRQRAFAPTSQALAQAYGELRALSTQTQWHDAVALLLRRVAEAVRVNGGDEADDIALWLSRSRRAREDIRRAASVPAALLEVSIGSDSDTSSDTDKRRSHAALCASDDWRRQLLHALGAARIAEQDSAAVALSEMATALSAQLRESQHEHASDVAAQQVQLERAAEADVYFAAGDREDDGTEDDEQATVVSLFADLGVVGAGVARAAAVPLSDVLCARAWLHWLDSVLLAMHGMPGLPAQRLASLARAGDWLLRECSRVASVDVAELAATRALAWMLTADLSRRWAELSDRVAAAWTDARASALQFASTCMAHLQAQVSLPRLVALARDFAEQPVARALTTTGTHLSGALSVSALLSAGLVGDAFLDDITLRQCGMAAAQFRRQRGALLRNVLLRQVELPHTTGWPVVQAQLHVLRGLASPQHASVQRLLQGVDRSVKHSVTGSVTTGSVESEVLQSARLGAAAVRLGAAYALLQVPLWPVDPRLVDVVRRDDLRSLADALAETLRVRRQVRARVLGADDDDADTQAVLQLQHTADDEASALESNTVMQRSSEQRFSLWRQRVQNWAKQMLSGDLLHVLSQTDRVLESLNAREAVALARRLDTWRAALRVFLATVRADFGERGDDMRDVLVPLCSAVAQMLQGADTLCAALRLVVMQEKLGEAIDAHATLLQELFECSEAPLQVAARHVGLALQVQQALAQTEAPWLARAPLLDVLRVAMSRVSAGVRADRRVSASRVALIADIVAAVSGAYGHQQAARRKREAERNAAYKMGESRSTAMQTDEELEDLEAKRLFPDYTQMWETDESEESDEKKSEQQEMHTEVDASETLLGRSVQDADLQQVCQAHARAVAAVLLRGMSPKSRKAMRQGTRTDSEMPDTVDADVSADDFLVLTRGDFADIGALKAPKDSRRLHKDQSAGGGTASEDVDSLSYGVAAQMLRDLVETSHAPSDDGECASGVLHLHPRLGERLDRIAAPAHASALQRATQSLEAPPEDEELRGRRMRARLAVGLSASPYLTANVPELRRLERPLRCILLKLRALLQQYPKHAVLLKIVRMAHSVAELPSTTPLAKALAGVEAMLDKVDDWARGHLQQELLALSPLVTRWRRIEVASWHSVLDERTRPLRLEAFRGWATLMSLVHADDPEQSEQQSQQSQQSKQQDEEEAQDVLHTVDAFVSHSPVAQFELRLDMLRLAAAHVRLLLDTASGTTGRHDRLQRLCNVFEHVRRYYGQYVGRVRVYRVRMQRKLLAEVHKIVKLNNPNWSNVEVARDRATKDHRLLAGLARQWADVAASSTASVLGACDASDLRDDQAPLDFVLRNKSTPWQAPALPLSEQTTLRRIGEADRTEGLNDATAERRLCQVASRMRGMTKQYLASDAVGRLGTAVEEASLTIIERASALASVEVKTNVKKTALAGLLRLHKQAGLRQNAPAPADFDVLLRDDLVLDLRWRADEIFAGENPVMQCLADNANKGTLPVLKAGDAYFYRLMGELRKMRALTRTPAELHTDLSRDEVRLLHAGAEHLFNMLLEQRRVLCKLSKMTVVSTAWTRTLCDEQEHEATAPALDSSETARLLGLARDVVDASIELRRRLVKRGVVVDTAELHSALKRHASLLDAHLRTVLPSYVASTVGFVALPSAEALRSVESVLREQVTLLEALLEALLTQSREEAALVSEDAATAEDVGAAAASLPSVRTVLSLASQAQQQVAHSLRDGALPEGQVRHDDIADAVRVHMLLVQHVRQSLQQSDVTADKSSDGDDEEHEEQESWMSVLKQSGVKRLHAQLAETVQRMLPRLERTHVALSRCANGASLAHSRRTRQSLAPLAATCSLLCDSVLRRAALAHRQLAKFAWVNLRLSLCMMRRGLLRPAEESDDTGDGEEGDEQLQAGGVGMGDGTGQRDVSDQIDNEDQLLDNQMASDQLQEDQDDQEQQDQSDEQPVDDDTGVEMTDNFDGQMRDIEEDEQQQEDQDSEDDEGEELDRDLGDDDSPDMDVVDERLWDEDDDQQDEDDQQQPPQDEKIEEDSQLQQPQPQSETIADDAPDAEEDQPQPQQQSEQAEQAEQADDEEQQDQNDDDEGVQEQHETEEAHGFDLDKEQGEEEDEQPDDDFDMSPEADAPMPEDYDEQGASEADEEEGSASEADEEGSASDQEVDDNAGIDGRFEDNEDEEQPEDEDGLETEPMQAPGETKVPDDDEADRHSDQESDRENDNENEDKLKEETLQESGGMDANDDEQEGGAGAEQPEAMQDDDEPEDGDGQGVAQAPVAEGDEAGRGTQQSEASQEDKMRTMEQANPFRSLGDALKQWRRDLDIVQRTDGQEARQDEDTLDADEGAEFEHVAEDEQADAQAMADAGDEQPPQMTEQEQQDAQREEEDRRDAMRDEDQEDTEEHKEDSGDKKNDTAQAERRMFSPERPVDAMRDVEPDEEQQEPSLSEDEESASTSASQSQDADRRSFATTGALEYSHENEQQQAEFDTEAQRLLEETLLTWRQDANRTADATELWRTLQGQTSALSAQLCEQLRTVLEPLVASKLRGDYRSGKRLNMRKVISYIASQFRKDKIWLRRTKPAKRAYQVMVAIDNSESMRNNGAAQLALQSLALLTSALTQLEVGELSVVSFGDEPRLLHDFASPFAAERGAFVASQFDFKEKRTNWTSLLDFVDSSLNHARMSAANESCQIVFVISDARVQEDREKVRRLVRRAVRQQQLPVLIVLDEPETEQGSQSILSMRSLEFSASGEMKWRSYLDDFPFPFYVVLRDLSALPGVLAESLRQWFELIQQSQQ